MIPFYKLSGAGNDFLALVEPEDEPTAESIRAWCSRGRSLGADGLFTLCRLDHGGMRMIHYNADGGRSELCINGTRCAARLAFHLGWADDAIAIHTDSGEIAASAESGSSVALELEPPTESPALMTLDVEGCAVAGWRIRVGAPHFVIDWQEPLASAPVAELGPSLRTHEDLGAAGANVHWTAYAAAGRFGIRSFERGVEGETLACGSGVLAAVAVGLATGRLELPTEATTRGGFVLRVAGRTEDQRPVAWSLAGDARLVAEGTLLPGSQEFPDPPAWV